MCIICVKNKGINAPTWEAIENMVSNNPDGNGYAYCHQGKVYIRKGLMTLSAYENSLKSTYEALGDDLIDTPFIYHSRITTHGGTKAGLCHPFVVSNQGKKLTAKKAVTDIAVAHNGTIDIWPDDGLSDTAAYIKRELYPLLRTWPTAYKNKDIQTMIRNRIRSKLAILDDSGAIVTIGQFKTDTETGLIYSNDSYSYRLFDDWIQCDDEYDYWYDRLYMKEAKKGNKYIVY